VGHQPSGRYVDARLDRARSEASRDRRHALLSSRWHLAALRQRRGRALRPDLTAQMSAERRP